MAPGYIPELSLISDEPIRRPEDDTLGLMKWARVIVNAALGSSGPLTIGVFGSWGVGKTSILELARAEVDRLSKENGHSVTTVMFNAWKYEQEEHPLIPLVNIILKELGPETKKKSCLQNALRAILYGLSAKTDFGIPALGGMSVTMSADKAIDRYEELHSRLIKTSQDLYFNAFEALRNAQKQGDLANQHKIIVFIDDLDRCFSDRALRILESIKLVLHEPGFIFALAVDRLILREYISKRFESELGQYRRHWGHEYLAKFIQLPLWIPSHDTKFLDYIDQMLTKPAFDDYRETLTEVAPEIGFACDNNPRQLVRFLNDLLVNLYIYSQEGMKENFPIALFVVGAGIRLHSEEVYRELLESGRLRRQLGRKNIADVDKLRDFLKSEQRADDPICDIQTLRRIQEDFSLASLLVSGSGRKWLRDDHGRQTVENLFRERESVSPEFRAWERDRTDWAIKQIASNDSQAVVSGCQWLGQVPSPGRSRAIPRLQELAECDEEWVAKAARRTLDAICPPHLEE